jgi:ABC-type glycerol-3-phosphate transport system substrate-binding protein
MNKLQIIIIGGSIILAIIALILFSASGSTPPVGEDGVAQLVVWGIDSPSIFGKLFSEYEATMRTKIIYKQLDERSYARDITEALASNSGPDLVITPSEWIETNHNKLIPLSASLVPIRTFETTYVDIASFAFIEKAVIQSKPVENIWALPLWIDPLVLYWNKDIFNATGLPNPPKNWSEVKDYSKKTTVLGPGGSILRSGVALGRAKNIPLFREIFSLIMLQQGAGTEEPFLTRSETLESTLRFYSDFGNPKMTSSYSWNIALPEPREMFLQGKLAMMLDFVSYSENLKARNPHLSFGVSPAPQLENAEAPTHLAEIRGITATRAAEKYSTAAWKFAYWLAGNSPGLTLASSHVSAPARRDLLQDPTLKKMELFPLAVETSLNAKRFHDPVRESSSQLLSEVIESTANGNSISDAATALNSKIKRVYQDLENLDQ